MMNKQVNVSDSPEKTTWELGLQKAHMSTTWVLSEWSMYFFQKEKSGPHPSSLYCLKDYQEVF